MAEQDTVRTESDLLTRIGVGSKLDRPAQVVRDLAKTLFSKTNIGILPAVTSLGGDDVFKVEQGGVEKKATLAQIITGAILTPVVVSAPKIDLIAANAEVVRIVAPITGKLDKVKSVLNSTPSTGDPALTTALTGIGNLSGGVATVTQSGSAAGDIDEITLTGTANDNDVEEGEEITVTVGGAGDTGGTANLSAVFVPRESGRPRDLRAARFSNAGWLDADACFNTGAADSKVGIISFWVFFHDDDASWRSVFGDDGDVASIAFNPLQCHAAPV